MLVQEPRATQYSTVDSEKLKTRVLEFYFSLFRGRAERALKYIASIAGDLFF